MKRLLVIGFVLGVVGLFVGFVFFQTMLLDLPKLDTIADYRPPQISRVFDAQGQLIGQFFTEKRTVVPIEKLPKGVVQAFLAAEDAHFYQHQGVDYLGLFRAALNEVRYRLVGGQRMGGSTITQQTVKTMLVGRQKTYIRKIKEFILAQRLEERLGKNEILNIYLNQIYFGNGVYGIEEAAQLYFGKRAADLTLSQAATLAGIPKSPNYLNPFTNQERSKARRNYVLENMRIHGFISEPVYRMALRESLLPKRQRAETFLGFAPYFVEEVRKKLIAELGEETLFHGGLRVETTLDMRLQIPANQALRTGLHMLDKRQGYRGPLFRPSPSNRESLLNWLKTFQKQAKGQPLDWVWDLGALSGLDADVQVEQVLSPLPTRPLRQGDLVTGVVQSILSNQTATLWLGSQTALLPMAKMAWARPYNPEKATPAPKTPSDVLKPGDVVWVRIDKLLPALEVSLEQIPLANGAFVALNPSDRRVLAMVGGYDFKASSFNRATQAKRQSGSAIKPFTYITALERKLITPATLITDAPKVYFDNSPKGQWKPRNSTRRFLGDITVHRCLVLSVNICSITILEKIGIPALRETATNLGLLTLQTPFPNDLTIALGSAEVIPIAFVNAFAIFPSLGQHKEPIWIERVLSQDGEILWSPKEQESVQIFSPQVSYVMTNIMRGIVPKQGFIDAPDLAGKTGTTNEMRSAWFVGYSQDLVAGAYVGFDNNQSLGPNEFGMKAAFPVWSEFMKKALLVIPARRFEQPEGIVWRVIDSKTGLLAKTNASTSPQATTEDESMDVVEIASTPMSEAFVSGTEPTLFTSDAPPPPLEMLEGGMAP